MWFRIRDLSPKSTVCRQFRKWFKTRLGNSQKSRSEWIRYRWDNLSGLLDQQSDNLDEQYPSRWLWDDWIGWSWGSKEWSEHVKCEKNDAKKKKRSLKVKEITLQIKKSIQKNLSLPGHETKVIDWAQRPFEIYENQNQLYSEINPRFKG